MEHCDLPTEMVPIYLLAFLHAFELLGWRELGQATGAHSVAWIRSYDCWTSDLAAQRLLWFNLQCHHVPTNICGFLPIQINMTTPVGNSYC